MKRPVIICLILASGASVAAAQSSNSGVRFGLTFSPQINWMSAADDKLESNGATIGYCYGLLMDILIPENYAFATGLVISDDGGSLIYTDPTKFNTFGDSLFEENTAVEYRSQYIEIPITMKLRTNQVGYITYFGQFGMAAGINIRSRADISNEVTSEDKIDFSEDVSLPSLGLQLGGGLEYEINGQTALHASLQYMNGFTDVTDNPEDFKSKSTISHFRLQLGVYF